MKLEELAEAIAIDVNETLRFDSERRWPEPRDIVRICSSLVTLTNEHDAFSDGTGVQYSEDS